MSNIGSTASNREEMMGASNMKLLYNIGGAVAGVVLATVAIFGLIAQQGSVTQPQKFSSTISYNQ